MMDYLHDKAECGAGCSRCDAESRAQEERDAREENRSLSADEIHALWLDFKSMKRALSRTEFRLLTGWLAGSLRANNSRAYTSDVEAITDARSILAVHDELLRNAAERKR